LREKGNGLGGPRFIGLEWIPILSRIYGGRRTGMGKIRL